MIRFLIDNSSLSELCTLPNAEALVDKVISDFHSGAQAICYNTTNFFEQIKGINSQHYAQAIVRLKLHSKISRFGILPSPTEHLRNSVDATYHAEAAVEVMEWLEAIHAIAQCTDHGDFVARFEPFQLAVIRELERCQYKKPFDEPVLIQTFVTRYGIGDLTNCMSSANIRQTFPSIGYMRDVHKFYKEKIASGWSLRPGDYIDLEQVVYLDACDYFISEDKRLRELINNCGNESLAGRAVTLTDYFARLETGEFGLSRAPRTSTMNFIPRLRRS